MDLTQLEHRMARHRAAAASTVRGLLAAHRPEPDAAGSVPLDVTAGDAAEQQLELVAVMAGVLEAMDRDSLRAEVERARELGATWRAIAVALGMPLSKVKGRYGAGYRYDQRRRAERRG